jgi:hypothetical protein
MVKDMGVKAGMGAGRSDRQLIWKDVIIDGSLSARLLSFFSPREVMCEPDTGPPCP